MYYNIDKILKRKDEIFREFKERNLEVTSYRINVFSDNYFEEIILIKK